MLARIFLRDGAICADLQNTDARQTLQKIGALLSGSPNCPYQRDKLLALCSILLLELAEFASTEESVPQPQKTTGDLPDATFQIDAFLGRNFMCNNAMPRMAQELHISTRQLHRMIRKHYQTNYRQKLSETRIKIALDMLQNSTMPIQRIGEILGYSSSSNFSIFVKRYTGKTPSQIRKGSNHDQE
jgi:AraC-like DNA-binding protein